MANDDQTRKHVILPESSIPKTTFQTSTTKAQVSIIPSTFINNNAQPPDISAKGEQLEEDDPFEGIPLISSEARSIAAVFSDAGSRRIRK